MPSIQFTSLSQAVLQHLQRRVRERKISETDLKKLETWKASEPEAPEGDWYKDFGSFKLCGTGAIPKTLLDANMVAYGEEIT